MDHLAATRPASLVGSLGRLAHLALLSACSVGRGALGPPALLGLTDPTGLTGPSGLGFTDLTGLTAPAAAGVRTASLGPLGLTGRLSHWLPAHTQHHWGTWLLGCLAGWGTPPRLTRFFFFCCLTRAPPPHSVPRGCRAAPRGSHGGALRPPPGLSDQTDRPTDLTGSMCARGFMVITTRAEPALIRVPMGRCSHGSSATGASRPARRAAVLNGA